MKMRLKMKNRSQRYKVNRPRPRYEQKYTKYELCLSIMMVMYLAIPKQHLKLSS